MLGRRKYVRIKAYVRVNWNIENGPSGIADVVDFSISGIHFIMDRYFEIHGDCLLYIEGKDAGRLSGIRKVRLKWSKKIDYGGRECLECGGDFI